MDKQDLKKLLQNKTGCRVQHTGWPCGTCFFSVSDKLDNKDWQTVLLTRGDYKPEDLDNLPKNIDKQLARIKKILTTTI